MQIKLKVKSILCPFSVIDRKENTSKVLYPVEVFINEPYGYIVNSMQPIPMGTEYVTAELSTFKRTLKLGHVQPLPPSEKAK